MLGGSNFTFNLQTQEIIENNEGHKYSGRKTPISILPRLINKYKEEKAFETHLQAYIIQNIGRNTNQSLDYCLLKGLPIEWIGNEVSCGVGMQRIDVMLSIINNKIKIVKPIELKATEASKTNIIQIQRYVDWLEQYYVPNRISDIQPILIAKKIIDKGKQSYRDLITNFKEFNSKNDKCMPLKYIEFFINEDEIIFKEITY